jgi:uncharacterized repeat protein (TIGR01451 family)
MGPAPRKNLVIRDKIPEGLRFRSRVGGMTLKWKLGDLNPKEEKKITYSLQTTRTGSFTMSARLYAEKKEVHKVDCTTTVVAPDLTFSIKGPCVMRLQTSGTYTIAVSNKGSASAFKVRVVESIPDLFDYISSSPKGVWKGGEGGAPATVTWDFEELPAKANREIQVELRAKKAGMAWNSARLTSNTDRPPRIDPLIAEAGTKVHQ